MENYMKFPEINIYPTEIQNTRLKYDWNGKEVTISETNVVHDTRKNNMTFDSEFTTVSKSSKGAFDFDLTELLKIMPDFNKIEDDNVELIEKEIEDCDVLKCLNGLSEKINMNIKLQDCIFDCNLNEKSPDDYMTQDKVKITEEQWAIEITKNDLVDFNKKDMLISYPFELDDFQKLAIQCLQKHQHVFVSAHTSAGKTVVAEYAIAQSLKKNARVIYTSPIKALSNQKYRDLRLKFSEVGLITGDFKINSDASCLIMTTEILQSMLYKASSMTRDLEWVIFDEVHYLNNIDRGFVWEEVLIMLPAHIGIVMLSATASNAMQFAQWVGETKRKKVFVISTDKRPVPLNHYVFCCNKKDPLLPLIVDRENKIYSTQKEIIRYIRDFNLKKLNPHQTMLMEKDTYSRLLNILKFKDWLPTIIFAFSRKKLEFMSTEFLKIDLTTNIEKIRILKFFDKSILTIPEEDRNLPQIIKLRLILEKGIGIHHGGILPNLKEIVEMLFYDGLVKILLATETFAMGVNMPAKTVVFDSVHKFDGVSKRQLDVGEYIQMAGRAGRRGIDLSGNCIILFKSHHDEKVCSLMNPVFQNKSKDLKSQFRMTYTMILNVSVRSEMKVQDIYSRSFSQKERINRTYKAEHVIKKVESEIKAHEKILKFDNVQVLSKYYWSCCKISKTVDRMRSVNMNLKSYLNAGRLVGFLDKKFIRLGLVICYDKKHVQIVRLPDHFDAKLFFNSNDCDSISFSNIFDSTNENFKDNFPYTVLPFCFKQLNDFKKIEIHIINVILIFKLVVKVDMSNLVIDENISKNIKKNTKNIYYKISNQLTTICNDPKWVMRLVGFGKNEFSSEISYIVDEEYQQLATNVEMIYDDLKLNSTVIMKDFKNYKLQQRLEEYKIYLDNIITSGEMYFAEDFEAMNR
ncbi:hypothetical protein A3Q56_05007, partial [Intoshia linei]